MRKSEFQKKVEAQANFLEGLYHEYYGYVENREATEASEKSDGE